MFDGVYYVIDTTPFISDDSTGVYSLYRTFRGREVMFHVSTMLPWTSNNRQQVFRMVLNSEINMARQFVDISVQTSESLIKCLMVCRKRGRHMLEEIVSSATYKPVYLYNI